MRYRLLLALALALGPSPGHARAHWDFFEEPWQAEAPAESPITFHVGNDRRYHMTRVEGRYSPARTRVGHRARIDYAGYDMAIEIMGGAGNIEFEDDAPSAWVGYLAGFFPLPGGAKVDIRTTGWVGASVDISYSQFTYPFAEPRDCAAFDARFIRFQIGGVACAPAGRTLGQADLERLVRAVGYAHLLEPKPLPPAP